MIIIQTKFNLINTNTLFKGISDTDFEKMFKCLNIKIKAYQKQEIIFFSSEPVKSVGLVIRGSVMIIRESVDGIINIISNIGQSEIFGEVLACAEINESPVTVVAAEDCEIMLINYQSIFSSCHNVCKFHTRLIENMLYIIARKNLFLNTKLEILSKRTIRERLMLYLSEHSRGNATFNIPFNREELASFLCVDRSALSNELSKLKAEGVITFSKNRFTIL